MATLRDYSDWLRGVGGIVRSGVRADEVTGMVPVVKLVAPDGRYLLFPSDNWEEVLSIHTIDYFDRRLGLLSPFRSVES